jgi:hypothetical protein
VLAGDATYAAIDSRHSRSALAKLRKPLDGF